eukprot:1053316-Amphidinium_carterae.1
MGLAAVDDSLGASPALDSQPQLQHATQPFAATACLATSSSDGVPSRAFALVADGQAASRCFPCVVVDLRCAVPRKKKKCKLYFHAFWTCCKSRTFSVLDFVQTFR